MEKIKFLEKYLCQFSNPLVLSELFEYIPNIHLYVKNHSSQFLHVNRSFSTLLGADNLTEVIGKTDHNYFPCHLADDYLKEDRQVMNGSLRVIDQVWLVPRANRKLDWFFSTKLPAFDRQGKIVGLVGYIRDCYEGGLNPESDPSMKRVADDILAHYSNPFSASRLAKLVGLSVSQMNRRFSAAYQISPQQFLLNVRMKIASQLLATSDESIASIVFDTGFFDQSHFSKYFRRFFDMAPNEYRNKYRTFAE